MRAIREARWVREARKRDAPRDWSHRSSLPFPWWCGRSCVNKLSNAFVFAWKCEKAEHQEKTHNTKHNDHWADRGSDPRSNDEYEIAWQNDGPPSQPPRYATMRSRSNGERVRKSINRGAEPEWDQAHSQHRISRMMICTVADERRWKLNKKWNTEPDRLSGRSKPIDRRW